MPKKKDGLSLAQVETLAAKMRDLPPVDKSTQIVSKQEAVRLLASAITTMQKRGYKLQDVAETLKAEGLMISAATLKNYLQRTKPTRKGKTANGEGESESSENIAEYSNGTRTVHIAADGSETVTKP